METLGEIIKKKMTEIGINSDVELEKLSGVSRTYINKVKNNTLGAIPGDDFLRKIASALQMTQEEVIILLLTAEIGRSPKEIKPIMVHLLERIKMAKVYSRYIDGKEIPVFEFQKPIPEGEAEQVQIMAEYLKNCPQEDLKKYNDWFEMHHKKSKIS